MASGSDKLSRVMIVVEIPHRHLHEPRTIHTFRFPDFNERGFYRTIRSYESWTRGSPPRKGKVPWNHPQFPGKFKSPSWRADRQFYHLHHDFDEFLDQAERQYTSGERRYGAHEERICPVFHHDDLWAFYDHIGWDHKNRVYRDTP